MVSTVTIFKIRGRQNQASTTLFRLQQISELKLSRSQPSFPFCVTLHVPPNPVNRNGEPTPRTSFTAALPTICLSLSSSLQFSATNFSPSTNSQPPSKTKLRNWRKWPKSQTWTKSVQGLAIYCNYSCRNWCLYIDGEKSSW